MTAGRPVENIKEQSELSIQILIMDSGAFAGQNPCILSNVHSTSEAHQAGLRHGDRLYKVNGIPVDQGVWTSA